MRLKIRTAAVVVATTVAFGLTSAMAQDVNLDTDAKKYSYAVGTKLAQQLVQQFGAQGSGIDMPAMLAGLNATVTGTNLKMTDAEADTVIEAQQLALQTEAAAAAKLKAEAGKAFLAENKAKEGVTETASGIQYNVLTAGDASGTSPTTSDTVVVHYHGTLIDGRVFDSSYDRGEPATFPLTGIIPGWQDVLQLMRPGDKWLVVIPPEQGYGERGAGGLIGPNETLMFEIELVSIR